MIRIEFEKMLIYPDFPGFSRQDIHEQTRKMRHYLRQGLNPFTGLPYNFWERNRYTEEDIAEVEAEMSSYWNGY